MKKTNKPTILNYSDYKLFLNDIYSYNKSINKSFSHRFISNKVGASSAGWFSNIISGRISLTATHLVRLSKLLNLSMNETEYLELLVKYEQSASIEEKDICYKKISSIKGIDSRIISKESFDFYNNWYISAIRELLFIYDFRSDFADLAKTLRPKIKVSEAKKAINTLKSLNLVAVNSKGFLKPTDQIIKKDSSFKTVHWANQIKSKGLLAIEAVDNFKKDERDLSEVFIPLSDDGFKEASLEIEKLRKRLLAISEKDKNRNKIYQCNFQLFPLSTQIMENKNDSK